MREAIRADSSNLTPLRRAGTRAFANRPTGSRSFQGTVGAGDTRPFLCASEPGDRRSVAYSVSDCLQAAESAR